MKITGEPYYDSYKNGQNLNTKNFILDHYSIPKGNKIILYAYSNSLTISATSYEKLNDSVAVNVLKKIGKDDKHHVILKMHSGKYDDFKGKKLVKQAGVQNVTVLNKANNFELFSITDLLIARLSTMAFEAILLDIPVILLNYPLKVPNKFNPFSETNAAVLVNNDKELLRAIEMFTSERYSQYNEKMQSARKRFLKEYFINSKSTNQTVEVINNIM